MRLFLLKYWPFSLRFHSQEQEQNYTKSKLPHQILVLKIFLLLGFLLSIISLGISHYDSSKTDIGFIILRIVMVIMTILIFQFQRKMPHLAELFLMISFTGFGLLFGQSTKNNIDNWGKLTFTAAGIYIATLPLLLIVARVGWIKCSSYMFILNLFCCFYLLPFEENYDINFFSLINFIFLSFFMSFFSYITERKDRDRFYIERKNEFTLMSFKELIKNDFPNPFVVLQDGNTVFENQEAMTSFNPNNKDGILKQFDNILIDSGDDEIILSLQEGSLEKENLLEKFEPQVMNTEIALKKRKCYNQGSLLEFLERSHSDAYLKQSYVKTFRSVYKSEFTQVRHYLDITIKNTIWEDKIAKMIIFSENKTIVKIQQLKQQSQYKDNLLATVSHDLRTPLNGIIGMLNECSKMISERAIKKILTIADRSANYLLYMVNDILDYHQIANGRLRLNLEFFSLWELIGDISKIIKFQAKSKGVKFIKENKVSGNNPTAYIRSDPNRLKQVVLNLLGNALKFTTTGSITITLEELDKSMNESKRGDFIIKVTDTGIGIKNEDQSRLFTLFGKLESSTKKYNKAGIGLGLAISQNLVHLLNQNIPHCEIKVKSQLGVGSCFYFPIVSNINCEDEENFRSNISEPQINDIKSVEKGNFNSNDEFQNMIRSQIKQMSNLKMLIVDDDNINLLVAISYVKSINYIEFETATNGLQALEKINSNAEKGKYFDFILMDCNMPVMNGFEATKLIRDLIKAKIIPDLNIIACTANSLESDSDECFGAGMDDLLIKPFTKNNFQAKIEKILRKQTM